MKKFVCILCYLLALSFLPILPIWGQQPFMPSRPHLIGEPPSTTDQPKLTTFDLNFPGGTPSELVKAIEKATKKPLNVIIPTDDADTQLPPLRMNDVNVAQLFQTLGQASPRTVSYRSNPNSSSYGVYQTYYSFKTETSPQTDSSIWYFQMDKPALPPTNSIPATCQFYQLQPYLNHGFTVDDITTAIQTGWKMAGVTSPPELNYHKETNLLIACGKPGDLETIQRVLDSLPQTSIDRSELGHFYTEADKVEDLESQIRKLSEKVSALTTNSPASTEKNSGK